MLSLYIESEFSPLRKIGWKNGLKFKYAYPSDSQETIEGMMEENSVIYLAEGTYNWNTGVDTTQPSIPYNCHFEGIGTVNINITYGTAPELFLIYSVDHWGFKNINFHFAGGTPFRIFNIYGCHNVYFKDVTFTTGFRNFARIRVNPNNGRRNRHIRIDGVTGTAIAPFFFNSCSYVLIKDCDIECDSEDTDHALYINYGNRNWLIKDSILRGADTPGYIVSIQGKDDTPDNGRNRNIFIERVQFKSVSYGLVVNTNANNVKLTDVDFEMHPTLSDLALNFRGDPDRDTDDIEVRNFRKTGPGKFYVDDQAGTKNVKTVRFIHGYVEKGGISHDYIQDLIIDSVEFFDPDDSAVLTLDDNDQTEASVLIQNCIIDINGGNGRIRGIRFQNDSVQKVTIKNNTFKSSEVMTKEYIYVDRVAPASDCIVDSNQYTLNGGSFVNGNATLTNNIEV